MVDPQNIKHLSSIAPDNALQLTTKSVAHVIATLFRQVSLIVIFQKK